MTYFCEQDDSDKDNEDDNDVSSKLSAFSNVRATVKRYKISNYQIRAVAEAAQSLCKYMNSSIDWGKANFAGIILGGSVQKGTSIADSYDEDLVFLLNVPYDILKTAHHCIIENMVYHTFFLRLSALVKRMAQEISEGGYCIEREYTISKTPYVAIVWKNIQFDVLVAFNCLTSSIELWDILIWGENLNETVKKLSNSAIDNNYLDIYARALLSFLKKCGKKKKKFNKLPKSYSLEIIVASVHKTVERRKKQEEEKKEDDNEEKKNKSNNEKKERKKVEEREKDQINQLLKEVLKAMIKFSMFKFDELQNFIMNMLTDISANQIAQLTREMEAMHPEQTIFIIDPYLPGFFYSQFIPVVEHDFTKWVDLYVELEFILHKLEEYGSRDLYFTFDQQYGLI
ncbi:hypothetical protein RFI_32460 [Reticulomyxa filosa]|uniref:Uncharacterized protein n=1 Tax=Reticulomyxa filosa TaxID=46433 RepID=X6LW60_RETFI|nr:hypothetical protein RFI_32460 [Reticulomyxa filosa]|eukprot:ETO04935.1 hypothetical protein RFI_32460 [Reticulomyxa filosa]